MPVKNAMVEPGTLGCYSRCLVLLFDNVGRTAMAILALLVSHQPSYVAMASIPPLSEVGGGPSPHQHLIPWMRTPKSMTFVFLHMSQYYNSVFISLALTSRVLGQVPVNEVGLRHL